MNSNAFEPPRSPVDVSPPRAANWFVSLCSVLLVPLSAAFFAYIPFRLLASVTNVTTWAGSDNFYYSGATIVWPSYSFVVAGSLALFAARMRIAWPIRILGCICGMVAMYFVAANDSFLGLNDSGQTGLFQYPANSDGFSTPEVSARLITPIYCITWLLVSVFSRPQTQDPKRRDHKECRTI